MKKNKRYDWPALIQKFERSGLTQTQFCEDNNLNPKYFSLRRTKFLSSKMQPFEKIEAPSPVSSSNLTIQVGRCKIQCPDSMPLQSFTTLVHSLA